MGRSKDAMSGEMFELLKDVCREAGLKLTRSQVEVVRELARAGEDATAENIHFRIKTRLPTISRATVRRTLKDLERFGVVHRVSSLRHGARPRSSFRGATAKRKGAVRLKYPSRGK